MLEQQINYNKESVKYYETTKGQEWIHKQQNNKIIQISTEINGMKIQKNARKSWFFKKIYKNNKPFQLNWSKERHDSN